MARRRGGRPGSQEGPWGCGTRPGRAGRIASRPSGWPVLRTPRWMLAAGVVLVAGLVLAAIPHRPSTAQRAADLRGMVHDLTTDIESCAGGVSDSITALRAIQSGASNDVKTAVKIANTAAANCSPANSMPMEDLVQYQAPGVAGIVPRPDRRQRPRYLGIPAGAAGPDRRRHPGHGQGAGRGHARVRAAAQGSARARRAARPDRPADQHGQHLAVRARGPAEPAQLRAVRWRIQIDAAAYGQVIQ